MYRNIFGCANPLCLDRQPVKAALAVGSCVGRLLRALRVRRGSCVGRLLRALRVQRSVTVCTSDDLTCVVAIPCLGGSCISGFFFYSFVSDTFGCQSTELSREDFKGSRGQGT